MDIYDIPSNIILEELDGSKMSRVLVLKEMDTAFLTDGTKFWIGYKLIEDTYENAKKFPRVWPRGWGKTMEEAKDNLILILEKKNFTMFESTL